MNGLSDAVALRQSLAEPARFAVVYERHLAAVHDYLRRRVGEGPAEDLAAEVFVRAFRGRSRYGVQYDTALPWLLGIATNVIGDHRRTETRRLATLEQVVTAAHGSTGDPPHTGLDPEVARALRRLRAPDRDALLLLVWGELSYEEAARALDVPIGTIRSRIARARRRLAGDLPREPITHSIAGQGEDHA
jgi:RNA polymerase sigma-70 factor (ECF subfamily)